MITAKIEWDEYLSNMYNLAFEEFHQTHLYHSLKRDLDRMESDCKINFGKDDFAYINAWIEAIMAVNSAECNFMYERGYQDCTAMLRRLEVI